MNDKQIILKGKKVFDTEIQALISMRDSLGESFVEIVDAIFSCEGKIILTGIGKPSHIAKKISATLCSLGTQSFFLDPSEACHGDLGSISKKDIVIAISYSGESEEVISMLPSIKMIGAKIIGISSNKESTLLKHCDIMQVLPKFEEACHLHLAPTSSTTVALCYGDALAVVLAELRKYKESDFGIVHPAGSLGKRILLKVKDIMSVKDKNPVLYCGSTLKEVIVEMSKKGLGVVSLVDKCDKLVGIITDGDIRRQLEKGVDIYSLNSLDVLTRNPITTEGNVMAIEALNIMKINNISCLPVVNKQNKVIGTIRIHDIISKGIIG